MLKKVITLAMIFPFLSMGQSSSDFAEASKTVNEAMKNERAAAESIEACLPPGMSPVVEAAEQEDTTPIDKQPRLGCAVILCLAAPQRPAECSPVMRALFSGRWLGHFPPKFPDCNSDEVETETKRIRENVSIRGQSNCRFISKRIRVTVFDKTLLNLKKKLQGTAPEPGDKGEAIYSVKLPMNYSIRWRGKAEDNIDCPVSSWKATDYRQEMPENEDKEDEVLNQLSDLPVCQKEEKECIPTTNTAAIQENSKLPANEQAPICPSRCVQKTDVEEMKKNGELPPEEQLPVCGDCEVTPEFVEQIFGKTNWLGASNLKSYPIYKTDKESFINSLNSTMTKYHIYSCVQKAHFITQTYFESDRYRTMKEYKPFRGTYKGGQKYHGRGAIQLTHNYNYKKFGKDFHSNPEKILDKITYSTDSAGFYWRRSGAYSKKHNARGDINKLIEAEPFNSNLVTKAVHGGGSPASVQAKRKRIFEKILVLWGIEKTK